MPNSQPRIRTFLLWTHVSLGLAAGLYFLVMCGTGVLLAYRPQLETILNHWNLSSHPASSGSMPLPVETLAMRIRANTGSAPESFTFRPDARQTVAVFLGRRAGTVYVDAYTGAILGRPSRAVFGSFANTMGWHTAMGLSGPNHELGTAMIDAANFASFFAILAGIYLWLPRQWTWCHVKAVLLFRPKLTGKARDFNWHNVIGIWTLVPLAVMVWSGVAISCKWADRATVQATSLIPSRPQPRTAADDRGFADPEADPDPFPSRVSGISPLLERAKSRQSRWGSISFDVPKFADSPVTFTIDPNGYSLIKGGMSSRLRLSRTGEELGFRGPSQVRGRGVYRFAHTGELWGQWGQTVAMLGCLGGVFLVWTGVSLSLRRFMSWRARR
jgi:uncharacterized iron-regulated membrane protein